MSEIKCRECEHCVDLRNIGNIRGEFHCKHPDKDYVGQYFKEHNNIKNGRIHRVRKEV